MPSFDGPQLMGPDGIQRRMQEIQSRLSSMFAKPNSGATGPTFDGALAPYDIHAPGVSVSSEPPPGLKGMINSAAEAHNVDPALLESLVHAESSYDPLARSRAGAMGLSQLMPDTARGLGVTNPFDPAQNLNGGAKYLRGLLDQFGDVPKALAAYNAGPGAVERHGGIPPYAETQAYVRKVLAGYEARKAR